MRTLSKILLGTCAASLASLAAGAAHAQLDLQPVLPNVLLLIDTSGSMERTVAGAEPTCNPSSPAPPESARSRWTNIIEALTGPVQNFSCYAQSRSDSAFINQYRLGGGVDPYDKHYYIRYHRPLSNGCTLGPRGGSIVEHPYNDYNGTCLTPWNQSASGFLDSAKDLVRFSLMTFDTMPHAGTGLSSDSDGVTGMWSYFLGFQGGGTPTQGNPPDCAAKDYEVGARNPKAPDWEGPLVPFPVAAASLNDVRTTNERIQNALITMRPYGATPLAGMFADARDFLTQDGSTWNGNPLGPKDDPCIVNKVRKQYVLLLSDGEPNMDLRPDCETGNGQCPYAQPWEIADDLRAAHDVETFAIGYSLSGPAGMDCNTIDASDFNPGEVCDNPTGPVKACCTLARIAINGGTEHGYFPDNTAQLNQYLSQIFLQIARAATRTVPVFATATALPGVGSGNAVGYEFSASLNPQPPAGASPLWSGNLERKRYVCESVNGVLTAVLKNVDVDEGDNFQENIKVPNPTERKFLSVVGDLDSLTNKIYSARSIRPTLTTDDGLGLYKGTITGSGAPAVKATFTSEIGNVPRALDLDPGMGALPSQCTEIGASSAGDCAERVMRWELGDAVGTQRATPFGAIFHSTPVVVGPPRDLIPDESYTAFAEQQANRPLVLYTATTDGQLHAFKVDPVDDQENNELWSFFPPYVLPRLVSTYNQQVPLVDGAPVVKNVIFERTQAQALDLSAQWRTVLVAGGGAGGGFYYALDVTDPNAPKFLWQLSTDSAGNKLFGDTTSTPGIATIELEENGVVKEVAVAVLAGGTAPLDTINNTCARKGSSTPLIPNTSAYQPRNAVRCWGSAGTTGVVGPARSITLVRLDNGQVIRTFRGHADEAPAALSGRTTIVNFDSPLTGVPVAYPSQPGEIADRIYVGDADGTLWRVDVSKINPSEWTAELAWDAYSGGTATGGQPIATPPIVSLDPLGNKVILLSTGDQEIFDASPDVNTSVWSITEKLVNSNVEITEKWVRQFTNGKRVTGAISLFNEVAYFSTYEPVPANANSCVSGRGAIWGIHYVDGVGKLPSTNSPGTFVESEDQPANTIVFGVAVTQTPTCVESTSIDTYFGAGRRIDQISEASFQLVYHTGNPNEGTSKGASVNTGRIELPAPDGGVRIDSWASVVE